MTYAAIKPGKVIDFDISRGNEYDKDSLVYFSCEEEAMTYAIKNPFHTMIQYEEVELGFTPV